MFHRPCLTTGREGSIIARDSCLYCEQKGVETKLIQIAWWMGCPIHDPQAHLAVKPDYLSDPLLRNVGQPGWPASQS